MKYPRKFALKSQNHKTGQRDAPPAASPGLSVAAKQRAGLGVETGAGLAWAAEGLVLMGLEKRIVG